MMENHLPVGSRVLVSPILRLWLVLVVTQRMMRWELELLVPLVLQCAVQSACFVQSLEQRDGLHDLCE